jgi:hypothetical protein
MIVMTPKRIDKNMIELILAIFFLVLLAGNNTITNETEGDEEEDECVPFNPDKAMECARGFRV